MPWPGFAGAVAFTIDELEGGGRVVTDAGGVTRWGIASRFHPGVDVANLKREDAVAIYHSEYWRGLHCDQMPPGVADLVFDCGVNPGPGVAIVLLQAELRVEADGVIGPDTLDAVHHHSALELVVGLTRRRALHYVKQAGTYPRAAENLDGWLNRSIRVAMRASAFV